MKWLDWCRYGLAVMLLAGLISGVAAQPDSGGIQRYPDVVAVKVTPRGGNRFDFDVTLSSRYDSPERYADAFRVMTPDGKSLSERILWHDHAGEQPFTRDLYGVTIPPQVGRVTVQGRDREFGYGGRTVEVALPGRYRQPKNGRLDAPGLLPAN